MNIDKAFESLEHFERGDYSKFKESDLTETDTRSKILDYFLKGILGWEENQIEREGFVQAGYFDYEIKTPTFRFLVEAKRNFVSLNLPVKGTQVKLRTIYKANEEVINQIRIYLFERGLQVGVITNGHQFVIAKFVNSDGSDWKDNDSIFFDGFEDVKKHFPLFYDLISKEAVTEYGRVKIEASSTNFSKRLLIDIQLRHAREKLNRNALSSQLIPILKKFFQEIYNIEDLNDKDLLEKCYVDNEDTRKYSYELSSIFADSPPVFDHRISKVQNTKNTQKQLKDQLYNQDTNYTPDPVILIGTAGAGKTTFIKNFLEFELSDEEKRDRPIVYLDFRGKTSQEIDDTKQIHQDIINLLQENFSGLKLHQRNVLETIYKEEIKKNKEGIWSNLISDPGNLDGRIADYLENKTRDPITHLQKISQYLIRQVRKKLCLVFDNADQLNEVEQGKVFLLAHSINRNLRCLVITCLREGYFYRWKDKPPFNAYHSTVFHITAPPYREVLKKRINYILANFQFEEITLHGDGKKVEFQKGSLRHLFLTLYSSLFKKEQSEILQFLEQTSYPNIRAGLSNFQTFLLSGHTKIGEYMSFDRDHIPIWEFIKSVALDNDFYYNSRTSKVKNIFFPSSSGSNHFTKIRLLHYLNNEARLHSVKSVSFTNAKKIIGEFVKAGYTQDVILEELNTLLKDQMIFTSNYASDIEEEIIIQDEAMIHISPIGHYYINILINRFSYIDLVLQDTPIFDEVFFENISNAFPHSDRDGERDLPKRLESSKIFLQYLQAQEEDDLRRSTYTNAENNCFTFKVVANIHKIIQNQDFVRLEKFINS